MAPVVLRLIVLIARCKVHCKVTYGHNDTTVEASSHSASSREHMPIDVGRLADSRSPPDLLPSVGLQTADLHPIYCRVSACRQPISTRFTAECRLADSRSPPDLLPNVGLQTADLHPIYCRVSAFRQPICTRFTAERRLADSRSPPDLLPINVPISTRFTADIRASACMQPISTRV